jgi:hypothetical protein
MSLSRRVEKLEGRWPPAKADYSTRTDEQLTRAIAEAAPGDLGLTAEQVAAMTGAGLLPLVNASVLKEGGR